jgi:catechol 2,3-dioxygenase-like lactoylglutathione lyase family enzyme
MVRGIDNIGICATDLASSLAFYETLGLSEAYRNDRGVMIAAGTVQLFLFATQRPEAMLVGRELGLFGNPPGIATISASSSAISTRSTASCARPVSCSVLRPRISLGGRAWSASRTQTATTFTCCRGSRREWAATCVHTATLSSSDGETSDEAKKAIYTDCEGP